MLKFNLAVLSLFFSLAHAADRPYFKGMTLEQCHAMEECLLKKSAADSISIKSVKIIQRLIDRLEGAEKKEAQAQLGRVNGLIALCHSEIAGTGLPAAPTLLQTTKWNHGSPNCAQNKDEKIQVVQVDENTYALRQNICSNFEAPFMYLYFGKDKVLLQDTGATSDEASNPIRSIVFDLIKKREALVKGKKLELIVTHSHGHGDHVAGDGQFANQPHTYVVGRSAESVRNFFNINPWPTDTKTYDLGEHKLEIIPIPGHENASVAVYDYKTGDLLTGDSLYPGRLYINNFQEYHASIKRLASFARNHHIRHILGTHIEMTATPNVDYPQDSQYRPDEHRLPLSVDDLYELEAALDAMKDSPHREAHANFIIEP